VQTYKPPGGVSVGLLLANSRRNPMKVKNFREEIRDELMGSSTEYCCYCLDPKGSKYSCCKENHFVPFSDLYEDDQNYLIDEQVDEYEDWSKK
jgi:hypothetical protein